MMRYISPISSRERQPEELTVSVVREIGDIPAGFC